MRGQELDDVRFHLGQIQGPGEPVEVPGQDGVAGGCGCSAVQVEKLAAKFDEKEVRTVGEFGGRETDSQCVKHVGVRNPSVIQEMTMTTQLHEDPEGIQVHERAERLCQPQLVAAFVHKTSRGRISPTLSI